MANGKPKKQPQVTEPSEIPLKIKEAAKRSGKPLEVVCARSFLEAPIITSGAMGAEREAWKVHVSSHYLDGQSDKIRELDVLARRQRYVAVNESVGFNAMLEVFMSCKGFPDGEYPIAFTVEKPVEVNPEDPPVVPTMVLRGKRSTLGMDAARTLLYFMGGTDTAKAYSRRTIGHDVVKDLSEAGKDWKVQGDRTLFEGLDSALRASFFWMTMQLPAFHSMSEGLIRVQIPVLVFSRPWHEIPVDGGTLGDPVPTTLGYVSNLYPVSGMHGLPVSLFTLLIARERLQDFQKALGNLYGQMWDWGTQSLRSPS